MKDYKSSQRISEQVKFVFVWPSGNRSQLIDEEILKMVEGVDVDFAELPSQQKPAHNHTFSTEEIHPIDLEVSELLKKGVIRKAHHSNKEHISPIFVRQMENDLDQRAEQKRRVFPLYNRDVKNCFGFSQTKLFCLLTGPERWIFFSACKRIFTEIHKVLLGSGGGGGGSALHVYSFPNGLACCPRLFTKLCKPVTAHLHMLGFIGDTLLMGDSERECVQNVKSSSALFKSFGFCCSPGQVCVDPISENHLFRV